MDRIDERSLLRIARFATGTIRVPGNITEDNEWPRLKECSWIFDEGPVVETVTLLSGTGARLRLVSRRFARAFSAARAAARVAGGGRRLVEGVSGLGESWKADDEAGTTPFAFSDESGMAALVARAEAVLFFHKFAGRTTQVCWPCCGREHVRPTIQRFANVLTSREWPMDVVDASIRLSREFRPRDVETVEALFKYAEELLPAGTVAPLPRRLIALADAPEDDPGWRDGFDEWDRSIKPEDLARSASFCTRSYFDSYEEQYNELDFRRHLRRWGNPAEPTHYGSDEETYTDHHLARTERCVKAGKRGSHQLPDYLRHVGWSGCYDGAPSVLYADYVTPNALRVVPGKDSDYDWFEPTIWEWGAGFALRANGTLPEDSWRGLGGGLGGALHRIEATVAADAEALADEAPVARERLIEQLAARRVRNPHLPPPHAARFPREHLIEGARVRHAALSARAVELRRMATAPVCFKLARLRALVLRGRATVSHTTLERACRLPESLFCRVAALVGPLGERAGGRVRLAELRMDEGYIPLDRKYTMEQENKADGEREREIVRLLAEVRSGGDASEYEDEDELVGELEEVRIRLKDRLDKIGFAPWRFGRRAPAWVDKDSKYKQAKRKPRLMVPWVTLTFHIGHVEGEARYEKPKLVISGWLSGFETFFESGDYDYHEGAGQCQLAAEALLREPTFRELRIAATPRQSRDEDLEARTWQPRNAPTRSPQTAPIR